MAVSEVSEAYVLRITEPMQIPAVVYEMRRRVAQSQKPLHILLDHQEEPNVVRGSYQPLENPSIKEIKRPDAGLSWYHPKTLCLTRGLPSPGFKLPQERWGDRLMDLLSQRGYGRNNLVYDGRDVYLLNGSKKQLAGLSGWTSQGVKIQRACWYEEDPLPEITGLLKADRIDPKKFSEAFQLIHKGFFDYLIKKFQAQEIDVQDFISLESGLEAVVLQKKTDGHQRGSCILG